MVPDHSDRSSFVFLIYHRLFFDVFPFPPRNAKLIGDAVCIANQRKMDRCVNTNDGMCIPAPIYRRNNAPCVNRQCGSIFCVNNFIIIFRIFFFSARCGASNNAGRFCASIGNVYYKGEKIHVTISSVLPVHEKTSPIINYALLGRNGNKTKKRLRKN